MKKQFYLLAILFLVTSAFGYIMEVIGTSYVSNELCDRGFLNLPLLPIYGFGSVMLVSLTYTRRLTHLQAFMVSVLICSVFEYITGYIMDHSLHLQLWSYDNYDLNLNYISYWSSIGFGIGGMIVIKYVYPYIEKKGRNIENYMFAIYVLPLLLIVLLDFIKVSISLFN